MLQIDIIPITPMLALLTQKPLFILRIAIFDTLVNNAFGHIQDIFRLVL